MKRVFSTIGLTALLLVVSGLALGVNLTGYLRTEDEGALNDAERIERYPILESCTRYDDVYDELEFYYKEDDDHPFDSWPETYHEQVKKVLGEATAPVTAQCDSQDDAYQNAEPGAELKNLAEKLPPWQADEDLALLKKTDFGVVLNEYLRVYECALLEYSRLRQGEILVREIPRQDEREQEAEEAGEELDEPVDLENRNDFNTRSETIKTVADREARIARKTLDRVLPALTKQHRFDALKAELLCVQRSSLDIRNSLALLAEATSCLPRIWDAVDPLREL